MRNKDIETIGFDLKNLSKRQGIFSLFNIKRVLVLSVVLFCAVGVFGASYAWTGAIDTAWNNAGNWETSLGVVATDYPRLDADTATFDSGTPTVTLPASLTVGQITADVAVTLSGNSTLTVTIINGAGSVSGEDTDLIMPTGASVSTTISFDSLTANGTISLQGSITTDGTNASSAGQSYSNAVTIGGSGATLNSSASDITFGAGITLNQALTLETSANISVTGAVTGGQNLTVNNATGITFNGAAINVGTFNVTSGTTSFSGTTSLTATAATTQNVSVSGNFTLNNGIIANGTLTNNGTFTTTGGTITAASIGGTGTWNLAGTVSTTGEQTYNGTVTLVGDTELTATGQTITFVSTVQSNNTASSNRDLTITAETIIHRATIGDIAADGNANLRIKNLQLNATTIQLTSGVRTTGNQDFNGEVSITNAEYFGLNASGGTIDFSSTFTGGGGSFNTSATSISFGGDVSGFSDFSIPPPVTIDGNITTGTQTYENNITTTKAVTLTASNVILPASRAQTLSLGGALTISDDLTTHTEGSSEITLDLSTHNLTINNRFLATSETISTLYNANITVTGSGTLQMDDFDTAPKGNHTLTVNDTAPIVIVDGIFADVHTVVGDLSVQLIANESSVSIGRAVLGVDDNGSTSTMSIIGKTVAFTNKIYALYDTDSGGSLSVTGTDSVTFREDIGIGTITGVAVEGITGHDFDSLSVTVTDTEGTVTFEGNVTTNTLDLNAPHLIFNSTDDQTITTKSLLTFVGAVTINASTTTGESTTFSDGFEQTGSGVVALSGNINSDAGGLSFAGATTLIGNTAITADGQNVTFGSTIKNGMTSGKYAAFSINAGTGTITHNGGIGANTSSGNDEVKPGAITLTANSIDLSGVYIRTIGDHLYDGSVTSTGEMRFNAGSYNIVFNNTYTGNGILATAATKTSFKGAVTGITSLSITGATGIGANITSSGSQSYSGAVTLETAENTLTSTGSYIAFSGSVTGAQTLNLEAGSYITFTGSVGDVGTLLTKVDIKDAKAVNINANFYATTLTFTDASPTVSFTPTATQTIDVPANSFTSNTGTIDINATTITTFVKGLTSTGSGAVSLEGTLVSTTGGLNISGATTLTGDTTLNADAQTITLAGTVNSETDENNSLTIGNTAAVTTVNLNNTIGVTRALSSLSINADALNINSSTITTTGNQEYGTAGDGAGNVELNAATTTLNAGNSGNISFKGTVQGNTDVDTESLTVLNAYALTFNGAISDIQDLTVTSGVGGISFADSTTATLTFTGTSAVTLAGALETTNSASAISFPSTVELDADSTVTSNNGAITFTGAVTGSGTSTFDVSSGTANIAFNNAANAQTTAIGGAVTLTSTGTVSFGNFADDTGQDSTSFGSLSFDTSTPAVTLAGSLSTGSGTITFPAAVTLAQSTTVTSTNANITFTGTVTNTTARDLTVNAGIRTATFTGNVGTDTNAINDVVVTASSTIFSGSLYSETLNITSSTISLNNGSGDQATDVSGTVTLTTYTGATPSGTISFGNDEDDTLSFGSFDITTGTLNLAGTVTTAGTPGSQRYNCNVILLANTRIKAKSSVAFTGTIKSESTTPYELSIEGLDASNPNAGAVTFGGAIGTSTTQKLSTLTVQSSGITINGGAVYTTGEQSYNSPVTIGASATTLNSSASGAITFAGAVVLNNVLTVETGSTVTFTDAVSGAGGLIVENSSTLTFENAIGASSTNVGDVNLTAITSTSFAGAVFATSLEIDSPTINVNGGTVITSAGQTYGTVSGGGNVVLGENTTFTAGNAATIAFKGTVAGDVDASPDVKESLTVNGASVATFDGEVSDVSTVAVTAAIINLNSTGVTSTGSQTYTGNVVLGAGNTLSATGQTITFTGDITGGESLALTAGTLFLDNGAAQTITVSNTPLEFDGAFTKNTTAQTTFTNGFTQTGSGAVSLQGTIDAGGSGLSFAGATTIEGATTLDATDTTDGNIIFGGTVTGVGQTLNLSARGTSTTIPPTTGLVIFNNAVQTAGLIVSETDVVVFYNTVNIPTTFTVPAAAHLQFVANSRDNIITLPANPISELTTGQLTIQGVNSGDEITFTNGLSKIGSGAVYLEGMITANANGLSFTTGAVTLTGATTLTANNASTGNISLPSVTGSWIALTLDADNNISFNGSVGTSGASLGTVTVEDATQIDFNASFYASVLSFDSVNGGTASDLVFDGSHTISVPKDSFSTVTGSITMEAPETDTANVLTFTNGFAQIASGTIGAVSLQGNITANANGLSFSGATTLTASTELTAVNNVASASDNITFAQAITGGFPLVATATGNDIQFGGAVATLESVNITANTIAINGGSVRTTRAQTYTGAVTLGSDTIFDADNDPILFDTTASTINGLHTLTVDAGTSSVTFDGAIGSDSAAHPSTVSLIASTININGGAVTTSGAQTYIGNVALGADTSLSAPSQTITFTGNVTGATRALALTGGTLELANTEAQTIDVLNAPLEFTGAFTKDTSFSTTFTNGFSQLGSGAVTLRNYITAEAHGLSFAGAASLTGTTYLTAENQEIYFKNTLGGSQGFSVISANSINFENNVAVTSVTINANTVNINGSSVSTTGAQTYGTTAGSGTGNVVIGNASTTLTAGNTSAISFKGSVNGDSSDSDTESLTIGNSGSMVQTVTFSAMVGNDAPLNALTVTAGSGGIYFTQDAKLGNTATLTANNGNIRFNANVSASTFGFSANAMELHGDVTIASFAAVTSGDVYITNASTFTVNNATKSATFPNNLYIVAGDGNDVIFNTGSNITVTDNFVLFTGDVTLGNSLTTTDGDVVLLGDGYANDYVGLPANVADLFAYNPVAPIERVGAKATLQTFPTETPWTNVAIQQEATGGFKGTLSDLSGKIITVGKNFYANGINLVGTTAWTLSIPDNNSASSAFAEAYNLSIQNASVAPKTAGGFAWLSAAENVTDVKDGSGESTNTKVAFARPVIRDNDYNVDKNVVLSGTYTVTDDIVRVEFDVPIENSNNEISAAVSKIKLHTNNDYNRDESFAFSGSFTNPAGTETTDGKGDLSVFYLRVSQVETKASQRWNTDATGTSSGDDQSSDMGRPGMPPEHRDTIPNVHIPIALADVYETLRDQYKNRIATVSYTNTVDRASPVLAEVFTGQEVHNAISNQKEYDAHNFIELRYSEAVDFGDATLPLNTGEINIRATNDLGHIANSNSTLELTGLLRVNGELNTGNKAEPNNEYVNALYRTFNFDGSNTNETQSHRLRVSIAGYVDGSVTVTGLEVHNYIGYIDSARSPSGQVTVLENLSIKDRSDAQNILDHTNTFQPSIETSASSISGDARLYSVWDTSVPSLAHVAWSDTSDFEILAIPNASGTSVERFEFHFHDNTLSYNDTTPSEEQWLNGFGWGESVPRHLLDTLGGSRPNYTRPVSVIPEPPSTAGGLRVSSLQGVTNAFSILETTTGFPVSDGTFRSQYERYIYDTSFFTTGTQSLAGTGDSLYLSMYPNSTLLDPTLQYKIKYDASLGFVTDLAGNRLPNYQPSSANLVAPLITLTLAPYTVSGTQEVFVYFNKALDFDSGREGHATLSQMPGEFTFYRDADVTSRINDLVATSARVAFTTETSTGLILTLNRALKNDELFTINIRPDNPDTNELTNDLAIFGENGSRVNSLGRFPVTYLGVNTVFPLNAISPLDFTIDTPLAIDDVTIVEFNGDKGLYSHRDITMQVRVENEVLPLDTADAPIMYLDSNEEPITYTERYKEETGQDITFWMPSYSDPASVFSEYYNDKRLEFNPVSGSGNLYTFSIGVDDIFRTSGYTIQFLFEMGKVRTSVDGILSADANTPLYHINIPDLTDLQNFSMFAFRVFEDTQRGGATILNNVINSNKREEVLLEVIMPQDGNLNVSVLTTDGNVVTMLSRGRKTAGNHYFTWDGTNGAGNAVARGMYFVRIVGPGIDETRKVMVVKD